MRFAVCDDDELSLRYLSLLISDYIKENCLQIPVDSYQSPEPILALIDEKGANPYSAIFFDIEMGEASGIEAARKIRETDRKFFLIFITGHSDYMQSSFELHTYDYLQKPADKGKIDKLLGRLISDMQCSPSVSFASDHKTVTLKISDILYITGRRNGAIIYSKGGEYTTGLALKDLDSMLAPPVCRCHNGYFVNLQQVSDFSHRTVTLKDGRRIPVGRAYYSGFLSDYNLYK